MSTKSKSISEEDLQAYVDGQLHGTRQDRVAAAIASDAELARRAEELRRLSHALHAAYDPLLDEAVPPEMLRAIIERRPAPLLGLAAAVAWMSLGGLIGAFVAGQLGPRPEGGQAMERPLSKEAAYAHAVYVPEVRHPVEVGAEERDHLNAWLSKRLAATVVAPDIREAGYQLVGGRLLPDAGRPAAQFMYEDAHGARVTLFVRTHGEPAREAAMRHAEDSGVGVIYWPDGPLAYALAGNIERGRLEQVAAQMYRALNP